MSDSDDELLSNSVFTFPNDGSTIMSARGPDINVSFALPRTLDPPRYAESNYERQRRRNRGMSPMSVASACDARFRAFNNSYYPEAMGFQRSTFNCRSGSPMSTRTCDTNTTLTATDIALALSNPNFNEREAKIINKGISKWIEMDKYKRIEKRRKKRLFLQRKKRLSYNSGDQASLSSSSDDNRSTKTTSYRRNMSSCRSTKTDISNFRRTIQESNIYKDCTGSFRHRSFLNRPAANSTLMSLNSARNMNNNFHEQRKKRVFVFGNQSNFQTQKERFQNGFPLPSQRFDKSIATSTIPETQRHHSEDSDSDDNIFSVSNNKNKTLMKRKRSIDDENAVLGGNKRPRVVSPCENSTEARRAKEIDNTDTLTKSNDFVFAKPSLPIRKSVKEKQISQSAPPLPEIVISQFTEKQPINNEITKDNEEIIHNITQSTDVSMRPSFIKRKLFTQKLDVTENRNVSSDNLAANSPQGSIYSAIQKEKHKARKLVTNQSCLNRDIQDDSNLLELIHKIVPPNSLNVTTQSKKTDLHTTKNKSNSSDKWDISSIISIKNNEDDCSDTFTDEDILDGDNNNTVKEVPSEKKTKSNVQKNNKKAPNLEKVPSKDELIVSKNVPHKDPISEIVTTKDKLPESDEVARKDKLSSSQNVTLTSQGPGIKNHISRFWETDSESDVEFLTAKRNNFRQNNDYLKPQEKVGPQFQGVAAIIEKTTAISDASIMSKAEITQRFNATSSLPVSDEVAKKDKLPITEKVTSKGKLPIPEKPQSVFRKPDAVSPLISHAKTCKVTVQKMPIGSLNGPGIKNYISRFWETDSESDVEFLTAKRNNFRENNNTFVKPQEKVTPQLQRVVDIIKKPTTIADDSMMSMSETTQRFNATSFKIKSHRSLKPKKFCDDNKENTLKSYFEPLSKKQNSNELIQTDTKKCDDKIERQKSNINITRKQREIKMTPTKILKTPPKAKQNKNNVEMKNMDKARELAKKQEPTKKQAKKQETDKAQAKKQETAKTQAKKQETDKAQAKKQETAKTQAKKQETDKAQAKKQGTAKKQETAKAQTKKQDKAKINDKEPQNKDIVTAKKSDSKTAKNTKTPPKTKSKENESPKTKENSKNSRNKKILLEDSTLTNKSDSKTANNTKTPPKTKSKENESPKTKVNSRIKKILLEDSSLTNSTLDNSKLTRPIRSCRLNSSTNSSNSSFNITMALRPRKTSSNVKCVSLLCSRISERTCKNRT